LAKRSPLKRVREMCLSFPETAEKEAWRAPTFRVRGKMFAMYMDDHHGDGRTALWLNAEPGIQEMLVESDPARFFVPPYQGPYGWIGVRVDLDPDWDEVRDLVEDSYRLTAPAKVLTRLDAGQPAPKAAGRTETSPSTSSREKTRAKQRRSR
jgi:hypothetical protein